MVTVLRPAGPLGRDGPEPQWHLGGRRADGIKALYGHLMDSPRRHDEGRSWALKNYDELKQKGVDGRRP